MKLGVGKARFRDSLVKLLVGKCVNFQSVYFPATLELEVVVTGPPGVPNQPEVWVIGASQEGRRKMLQLYFFSSSRITLD